MRSRNRSGVTDNNDAPGDYMIRSEVADGLGEGLRCRLHDLAKRKGKQVLCVAMEMLNPPVCQQTFGDGIAARMAVAIDHDLPEHAFIRDTVPNPVVEPVARMDIVMLRQGRDNRGCGSPCCWRIRSPREAFLAPPAASRLREAVLAMRDNPHRLAAWSARTADARLNLPRRRRPGR